MEEAGVLAIVLAVPSFTYYENVVQYNVPGTLNYYLGCCTLLFQYGAGRMRWMVRLVEPPSFQDRASRGGVVPNPQVAMRDMLCSSETCFFTLYMCSHFGINRTTIHAVRASGPTVPPPLLC